LFVFSRLNSCNGLVFPLPDAGDEDDLNEDAPWIVFGRIESIAVVSSESRKAQRHSETWSYKQKAGLP
jgi:hypothetical protein